MPISPLGRRHVIDKTTCLTVTNLNGMREAQIAPQFRPSSGLNNLLECCWAFVGWSASAHLSRLSDMTLPLRWLFAARAVALPFVSFLGSFAFVFASFNN
jgi:hypothetical protein